MALQKPKYEKSGYITSVTMGKHRLHKGDGDMWPLTWGADGNIYAAAGDNLGSPLNVWKVSGNPSFFSSIYNDPLDGIKVELIDNMPLHPAIYCQGPDVHPDFGIKPTGMLSLDGTLYMAVQNGNYAEEKYWFRQRYTNSWICTSSDFGKTWNREATPRDFFTGKFAAPSFLQYGKDYSDAPNEFVYAYFTISCDGVSMWENADQILLGRVNRKNILERGKWEFYVGQTSEIEPIWSKDGDSAIPIFEYPLMTGQNHVAYNKGIGRYLMGNYGFVDESGEPRPYHANDDTRGPSQLTIFESKNPWGPWKLFYTDENWGTYGDYQPNFPTKWISDDGLELYVVSSGSYDDYNFTVQKMTLAVDESER